MQSSSTMSYRSTIPASWDNHHDQFTSQQHLQLEEEDPYLLASQDSSQYLQQQRGTSGTQHLFDRSLSSPQYNSLASNQYGSGSTYQQPPSFPPSSMTPSQGPSLASVAGAFTFTPQSYGSNSTQPGYQTSFTSGINQSTATRAPNPISVASTGPSGPGFPMQFPYTLQPPARQSDIQSQAMNHMATMAHQLTNPLSKRHRVEDDSDEHRNESGSEEHQEQPDPAGKPRPTGACARCKSLKVRCEFRGDNDICKRCTTAGQECVIPGRKPRRTPPKREVLLKQIREQAAQIQMLMAELEAPNRRAASCSVSSPSTAETPLSPSSSVDLHSPTLDPDTPGDSGPPRPEVQDWIAKARASIEAFGGLIALGGTVTVTHPENSAESDEDEYGFDFEDETEDGYATADEGVHSRRSQSPSAALKKNQLTDQKGILPPRSSPFGLIAHMSIRARGKSAEPEPQDAVGVAGVNFFRPSSTPDSIRSNPSMSHYLPHILTRDVITVKDAENLFKLYFDKMNMSASLLDPVLYTPQYVVVRSPFLFTVLCAVASRFYTERPGLYAEVMRYAQLAAGTALITGPKNEEMCVAYLLLQLYPVPSRRWEEDRSWIYLGVAIRLAQDLNLNKPRTVTPLNEHHARVLLNRTRVWINCFNLDRSTGSQYGKAPIIPNSDYIVNHLHDWWNSSEYNMEHFDIHLCIYSMELNIGAKFMGKIRSDPNHPTGLNMIATETDDELASVGDFWFKRLDEFKTSTPLLVFRTGLLKMAFSYSRLVVLSFGLQHAKENHWDENSFLMRCFTRASDVINAFVNRLYTTPEDRVLLRHAPEAQYVFVSFAGAFLVKLLQPKYSQYFTHDQRVEIRDLVQKTVDLLGAPDVALDEKHGPYLYSRFLAGLLASPAVRVDLSPTSATNPHAHKRPRKPKTPTTKTQGGFLADTPGSSDYASPSCSPSPSYTYPHAESFTTVHTQDQAKTGINAADMFHGPIPMCLDTDLLESAQIMADPLWQDTMVPGFQWMGQMQSYNPNDYSMYDLQQFGSMS
ncbi:hypothetical protein AZE42_02630 [Rhizopogon vesiculosus]|uniref:Zn(2)-C6 fungal-type domain-containing protein n=1 Tax=Rhizopogon vesiculosus TaxID=180088 RepID=A0A1J8Q814_9AGAM|nr:hypothetical protein AZE42_02630 [Rhizopogon vesiculosus]